MLWVPTVDDGCRLDIHFQRRTSESSKTRVAVELNKLHGYFNGLLGGQTEHHGDDVCGGSCVDA